MGSRRTRIGISGEDYAIFILGADENLFIGRGLQAVVAHMHGIVAVLPQLFSENRR
jgi:hypothetical protein